jgi:hypothetical protein
VDSCCSNCLFSSNLIAFFEEGYRILVGLIYLTLIEPNEGKQSIKEQKVGVAQHLYRNIPQSVHN